jgi:hypothetical protein
MRQAVRVSMASTSTRERAGERGGPDDVTLFGHWICPFSVRVSFALAQREIPHHVVDVPPTAARPKGFVVPEEFVAHSPKGEIPLVRIGTEYRADSLPILEWLEDRRSASPLLPGDAAGRAFVLERAAWIDREVFPPMIGVYYGTRTDAIERSSAALTDGLERMGQWLDDGSWLAGPGPTVAEAVIVPVYARLEGLVALGFTGRLDHRVAEHLERCRDLPGGSAVWWTAAQTDEFVNRFERYRAIVAGSTSDQAET